MFRVTHLLACGLMAASVAAAGPGSSCGGGPGGGGGGGKGGGGVLIHSGGGKGGGGASGGGKQRGCSSGRCGRGNGGAGGPGGGGGGGGGGKGGKGGSAGGQNAGGQNGAVGNDQEQGDNNAIDVPVGAQITLNGDYGMDGEVYLNINDLKLPLAVDEWFDGGITLTVPALKLNNAQSAAIEVVPSHGQPDSIAIRLIPPPKLLVNSGPRNGGGAGADNVADAQ